MHTRFFSRIVCFRISRRKTNKAMYGGNLWAFCGQKWAFTCVPSSLLIKIYVLQERHKDLFFVMGPAHQPDWPIKPVGTELLCRHIGRRGDGGTGWGGTVSAVVRGGEEEAPPVATLD